MFTSPSRAIYCDGFDSKKTNHLNSEEQRDKLMSRLSTKETKGYKRSKAMLALLITSRK